MKHTLLRLSQASYIKIKAFWLLWGELQSDFSDNLTEFYQISLKILVYLTDFSPQFMACMTLTVACLTQVHHPLYLRLYIEETMKHKQISILDFIINN